MKDSSPVSAEVEEPIINSPYEEPKAYWKISLHEPPQKINARRPATYFYIPPGTPPKRRGKEVLRWKYIKFPPSANDLASGENWR